MASSEVTITVGVDTSKLVRTLEAISRHAAELAAELTEIATGAPGPAERCSGECGEMHTYKQGSCELAAT
jgi:hypothetical protein